MAQLNSAISAGWRVVDRNRNTVLIHLQIFAILDALGDAMKTELVVKSL